MKYHMDGGDKPPQGWKPGDPEPEHGKPQDEKKPEDEGNKESPAKN